MTDRLTLTRPDDWHIHLRDGDLLKDTVADASRYFGRAIVMPNLVPPVRNGDQADAYRERILAARPAGSGFEPLMVLYLAEIISSDDATEAERLRLQAERERRKAERELEQAQASAVLKCECGYVAQSVNGLHAHQRIHANGRAKVAA